jgi:hypothetical protein
MRIFSITQNDYGNYCECPKCKEIAYKYGKDGEPRWSAPIVWSVNEIARRIKAWQQTDERVKDREILLETFGYLYGVKPPVGLKAEDNVIVRMITAFCWLHNIDDENCPYNKQLKRHFKDWQALTKHLYVWCYPQNHAWYIAYNAVLHGFRSHIKFLADNNIMGIFEEMGCSGRIGALFPVKQYLYARLTWNPDMDFEGEYKEAMEYFELKWDDDNYSRAFKQYRKIWVEENIFWIVVALFLVMCVPLGVGRIRRIKWEIDTADIFRR